MLDGEKGCCKYGCCGELEFVMQLTGDWSRQIEALLRLGILYAAR